MAQAQAAAPRLPGKRLSSSGRTASNSSSVVQTDLQQFGETFGFPFMLKSRTLAYDGRGNAAVASPSAADGAVRALGGFAGDRLYAEQWAPFEKELAVMVARAASGAVCSFPLVETVHEDSILLLTEAPAAVTSDVEAKARALAEAAVACLDGAGIFGCVINGLLE